MTAYYISKRAIYTHGIYGPYETVQKASDAFYKFYKKAEKLDPKNDDHDDWLIRRQFDGHHDYFVIKGLPKFNGLSGEYNKVLDLPYEYIKDEK